MYALKAFFIFLVFGFLSGCGFRPIYQESGKNTHALNQVKVAVIENREGQILKNYLDHAFGVPEDGRQPYTLSVKLRFRKNSLSISKSATTSQEAAHLYVTYTLKRNETQETLLSSNESFSSSTSVSADSPYSGWISEKTIFERLTKQAAESIRTNVTVALLNDQER